ncbi:MAG: TetR/AcrR family transcriptional regulator [Acidimicrobiales bacterium]
MSPLTETLARRAVERTIAERRAEYTAEVQRIVEATFDLIETSGRLDPSLREILAATGLSTQAFYRLFRSKDELLLALLDDGRRRLVHYLSGRMAAASTPAAKIRAWIEGVLAQASTPRSANRTRPFLTDEDRLSELFPDEQRESVDLLEGLLVEVLAGLRSDDGPTEPVRLDAEAIYCLVFGVLHFHLIQRTRPTPETVEHTVQFCLRGAGVPVGAS